MAARSVISSPELVDLVASFMSPGEMAPALRASRVLFGAFAPLVWFELPTLTPLFQLCALDRRGMREPTREVPYPKVKIEGPSIVGNFDYYRGLVRTVEVIPSGGRGYKWKGWETIAGLLPLCPRVQRVTYTLPASSAAILRPEDAWDILKAHTMRSFTVRAADGSYWPWMSRVEATKTLEAARFIPALASLDLYFKTASQHLGAMEGGLVLALAELGNVRHLGLGCDLLNAPVFAGLGGMPNLRSLALRGHTLSWNELKDVTAADGSFEALRRLSLKGMHVDRILRLLRLGPLCSRLTDVSIEPLKSDTLTIPANEIFMLLGRSFPDLEVLNVRFTREEECWIASRYVVFLLRPRQVGGHPVDRPLRCLSVFNVHIDVDDERCSCELFHDKAPNLTHLTWTTLPVWPDDLRRFASRPKLRVLGVPVTNLRERWTSEDLTVVNPNRIRLESDYYRMGDWETAELKALTSLLLTFWTDVELRMAGRALRRDYVDASDASAFLLLNNELARKAGRPPFPDGLVFE